MKIGATWGNNWTSGEPDTGTIIYLFISSQNGIKTNIFDNDYKMYVARRQRKVDS